jgi:mannose-1-phosphate guanylyltransferase
VTEAIILVGGQGTRLRPLTNHTPKPMLPVAGVPLVEHQIRKLAAAGIQRIVLATSYRADTFRTLGDGGAFGLQLTYAVESEPLGTGGAIRHAADELSGVDDVVVLNGDVLSGHDLVEQLAVHRSSGAVATMHLVRVADPRAFGCVPTDASGRVQAFLEKDPDPVTDQINAGCYVLSADALSQIPHGRVVSVERETFPGLLAAGTHLQGYLDEADWLDLGTPADYVRGCRDVVTGDLPSPAIPNPPGEALLLAGAQVDPVAVVEGGSTIGAGAVVAAGAVVRGSVLRDGAHIGPDAVILDSAIGQRARVGAGARLERVTVGDDETVADGSRPEAGSRI